MSELGMVKTNEELQEEIKNLGIQYRYSCYREKNFEGCDYLANFFELIEKDYEKAGEIYKENCMQNSYGKSCYHLGVYRFLGRGMNKDLQASEKAFERGCNLGFGDACYMSGYMKIGIDSKGKNVPLSNKEKGIQEWRRGCDARHGLCCVSGSNTLIFGKYGIPKDMEKAFHFAEKGCELNEISACNNLSTMYKLGDGVERNDQKAEFYKNKTSDLMSDLHSDAQYSMELYTENKSLLQKLKGLLPFRKDQDTE